MKNIKETVLKTLENKDLSFLKKIDFNLHHLTSVCVASLLAFFIAFYATGFNTARANAASIGALEVEAFNLEAIEVQYGDASKVAEVAKEILADQVSVLVEPKVVEELGMTTIYEIDEFIAIVEVEAKLGDASAKLSLQTKKTYVSGEEAKVVAPTEKKTKIQDGAVYVYNIDLKIVDTEAPKFNMVMDDTTIMDYDDFDPMDYVASVIDNADGLITDIKVDNPITKKSNGNLQHGRHYVKFTATDSSGNTAEQTLIVRIYTETSSNKVSSSAVTSNKVYASSAYGSTIANAALAQVGRNQDCTMLVTNSLRAVGIYHHGWPYSYLGLGTIVPYSQAQAGDIVVYNGHVAIYIGNGMCVHGGWNGYTTVVYSIHCASGAFTIVRV